MNKLRTTILATPVIAGGARQCWGCIGSANTLACNSLPRCYGGGLGRIHQEYHVVNSHELENYTGEVIFIKGSSPADQDQQEGLKDSNDQ